MNAAGRAIERAAAALAAGGTVALIDDEGVGHLVREARDIEAAEVVAMLDAGGGIFSVVVSARRCAELGLPEQERSLAAGNRVAASIDAREGTTTGISAAERANTARVAADPGAGPEDLVTPGHVPPFIAADAGVFARRAAPEAAFDLSRLAGGAGTVAICAILDAEGRAEAPGRVRELDVPVVSVNDVVAGRLARERLLRIERRRRLVTHHGVFAAVTLASEVTGETQFALVRGDVEGRDGVPVAIAFSSAEEDFLAGLATAAENRLARALQRIARVDRGIIVHLRDREGDRPRQLDIAAAAIAELGPESIQVLEPDQAGPLRERGLRVEDRGTTPGHRPPSPPEDRFEIEFNWAI